MYVLPYLRIVDSLVAYSLKWRGKSFMYVLPYLRIVDSLVAYSLKWRGKSFMYVLLLLQASRSRGESLNKVYHF